MKNIIKQLILLNRIRKTQWLAVKDLESLQNKKLEKLISYAYKNSQFYRKRFDTSRITPNSIKSVDDLQKLPIITRKEIQAVGSDEVIPGIYKRRNNGVFLTTSGTTHEPMKLLIDKSDIYLKEIFWARILMNWGVKLTDKRFCITGTNIINLPKSWHRCLGINRKEFCSVLKDGEYLLKRFIDYEPDILSGFTGGLLILAQMIKDNKDKIKKYPKLVSTTSQMLFDDERDFIKKELNADVMDVYATMENGFIAWECDKHEGYHIDSENIIVEFLKDNEPVKAGEQGEIVVTNLNSYTMPFIRYKTGDIGVAKDNLCSCGRCLPLIKKITGRREDFIRTPQNKIFSPHIISSIMKDIEGLKQYQVIQERKNLLIVNIQKDKRCRKDINTLIVEALQNTVGIDMEVVIKEVDIFKNVGEIKTRRIFSYLNPNT